MKRTKTMGLMMSVMGCLAMSMVGCGQKGNLYLPNSQSTIDTERGQDVFLIPEVQERIEDMQNDVNDF